MPESLIEYPAADVCLLYLLRHGATGPNLLDPPIMQGKGVDSPLAAVGIQQAERAAAALADRPIKALYASPMTRAMQTAEIVGKSHQLTPTPMAPLVEAEVGLWEGKSWEQIRRDDEQRYLAFRKDPSTHGYPGGENLTEVHERVTPCLAQIMQQHIGQEIVVVAHSVVNRVYLGQLLGLSIAGGYRVQQLNCAINVVRWKNDSAKAVTVNGVAHLMG